MAISVSFLEGLCSSAKPHLASIPQHAPTVRIAKSPINSHLDRIYISPLPTVAHCPMQTEFYHKGCSRGNPRMTQIGNQFLIKYSPQKPTWPSSGLKLLVDVKHGHPVYTYSITSKQLDMVCWINCLRLVFPAKSASKKQFKKRKFCRKHTCGTKCTAVFRRARPNTRVEKHTENWKSVLLGSLKSPKLFVCRLSVIPRCEPQLTTFQQM